MLNLEASYLADEISRAEDFRKKHTSRTRDIIRRFAGNWYRLDNNVDPTPENLVAAYVAFMLPELAFNDPAIIMQSTRPAMYKQLAEFLEMALDSWMLRAEFGETLGQVVQDMLMGYGVVKVGLEPVDNDYRGQGISGGPLIPFATRVPPDQFVMDSRCERWQDARFLGHTYFRDLTDLESQPDLWDPEAVESISTSTDDDMGNMNAGDTERPFGQSATPDRKRVTLTDLWVKETQQVITLAKAGKTTLPIILRTNPYYGPREGPYEVFGAYRVQGDPYPIGPLQFAMEQFEELQAHVGSASDAAKSYKRAAFVDATAKDLQEALANSENGSVMPIRGFNPNMFAQLELGGVHPEVFNYIGYTRDRWDRTMGMGDAMRGNATGGTATETQIVQSNSDGRTSWLKSRVVKSTRRTLARVRWYLWHEPNVVLEVSKTNPLTQQVFEGLFLGGIQPGQELIDDSNFTADIIADSMSRTDDQVLQARAMQIAELAPEWAQLKLTAPILNVDWMVDMVGEAMNIKDLSKILFNPQGQAMMMQAMAQQAAQQQAGAAQGQGAPGMPPRAGLPPGWAPGGPPGPMAANAGLGFPPMGAMARRPAGRGGDPGRDGMPDNRRGFARPVSHRSNGQGASPLPRFGMPTTQKVGAQ